MNALFSSTSGSEDYSLYDVLQGSAIAPAVVINHPPEVLARIDPATSAGSESCGPIKRKRSYKHDSALVTQAHAAKDLEWTKVFQAMQNAFYQWFDDCENPFESISTSDFITHIRTLPLLSPREQFEERLTRFLQAACKCSKVQYPKALAEIVQGCCNTLNSKVSADIFDELERFSLHFFSEYGISLDSILAKSHFHTELAELAFEFEHGVQDQASFARDSDKFWGYIETCTHLLTYDLTPQPDAKPIVLTALYKIRDALNCTTYKLYKTNETHPGVHLVHNICQALYAQTEVLPAYTLLGEAMCKKAVVDKTSYLRFSLTRIWNAAFTHGISNNDPKNKDSFWTRLSKSCQVLLEGLSLRPELAIQNSWRSFTGYAAPFKDHHGFFENNPGALAEEEFSSSNRTYHTRTVTSASPAYGKQIVPEFLALLQALENRHFYDVSGDIYPYTKVAYTNLQSKKGDIEGLQTAALMTLNIQYPFSFSGITVSQESSQGETDLTPAVVKRVYQKIISDDSFSLRNTPGYYFLPQDRKNWSEVVEKIAKKSYSCFSTSVGPQTISAFEELLNLGIIRYHEMRTLQSVGIVKSKMINMRVCQAGVDRAGKINAGLLWPQMPEHSTDLISSIIFGRAVLAKGRLPTQDKLKQFENLISRISQQKIKEFLNYVDRLATGNKIRSRSITFIGVEPR